MVLVSHRQTKDSMEDNYSLSIARYVTHAAVDVQE